MVSIYNVIDETVHTNAATRRRDAKKQEDCERLRRLLTQLIMDNGNDNPPDYKTVAEIISNAYVDRTPEDNEYMLIIKARIAFGPVDPIDITLTDKAKAIIAKAIIDNSSNQKQYQLLCKIKQGLESDPDRWM